MSRGADLIYQILAACSAGDLPASSNLPGNPTTPRTGTVRASGHRRATPFRGNLCRYADGRGTGRNAARALRPSPSLHGYTRTRASYFLPYLGA